MDLTTNNKQEEFQTLHPSLQTYFTAGIDTNPYGNKLVSQKNFFNFDLFNNDPYKLDPQLSERTEKLRGNPNYFVEGVKAGTSHALELIGSVPGGLDRFYDWGRETLGFQPTEDSIFDYAESYLKDIAHDINPEYNNMAKPQGFNEKFWYGLGMAIPTIISYIPFIRATGMAAKGLQTVGGIGKTARALRGTGRFLGKGNALPAGIGITDMIREIDDGKFSDIAISGAYGYGTGTILNVANKLNILPRMAVLGSTGYLSAGWEASNEDRLASAAVWATLGVFGPIAEGKPVKRQLTDLEVQTKQLFGQLEKPKLVKDAIGEVRLEIQTAEKNFRDNPAPTEKGMIRQKNYIKKLEKRLINLESASDKFGSEKSLVAEKMFQNAGIIRQHKETIKKAEEVSKIQELNEQKLLKGEEPAPITEQMKNEMMSSEQIAQTKKFIRDLEYENTAYGKIIWTNNNYNSAIFGLDKRPGEVFKQDMYNVDGSKKYADMKETRLPSINLKEFAETKGPLAKSNLVPAKFINHPVVKYINDRIFVNKRKIDTMVEQMTFDPMFAADSMIAPGRGQGKSFGDYMLRLNSTAEAIRLAGMRQIKTDGGAITQYQLLRLKDPKRAAEFVETIEKIQIDKLKEAKKNKEDYTTRVDLNEGLRRSSKKDLTPDEIRRIEELQQSRTEENAQIVDAEIQSIRGFDPFIPVKQGHYKYEVTDKELRTKYKFDDELVKIYNSLRGLMDKTVDHYNTKVKENKADGAGFIEKVPNYFPHIFTGDFVVFLKKWKGKERGYRPVYGPGAEYKVTADAYVKYFKNEYDAIDVTGTKFNNRKRLSSDYIVTRVKRDRSKLGNEEFDAFNRLFEKYD